MRAVAPKRRRLVRIPGLAKPFKLGYGRGMPNHKAACFFELSDDWRNLLRLELSSVTYLELVGRLKNEYRQNKSVYPHPERVFRALNETKIEDVRVVVLGQDPYHDEGQAIGRAFAVPRTLQKLPPSLRNIFRELNSDLEVDVDVGGLDSELEAWVQQGVFLLNTRLTVGAHQPMSHAGWGWEALTSRVIQLLASQERPIVFFLWGSAAHKYELFIYGGHHLVIKSAHPSPLSAYRGFFGSRPFTRANKFLQGAGEGPIDWLRIQKSK